MPESYLYTLFDMPSAGLLRSANQVAIVRTPQKKFQKSVGSSAALEEWPAYLPDNQADEVVDERCIDVYSCDTMRPSKIMYSLRLDPHLARLLKAVKARDGIPESEQIRRALAIWFEQKGMLKPRTVKPKRKRKS